LIPSPTLDSPPAQVTNENSKPSESPVKVTSCGRPSKRLIEEEGT